MIIEKEYQEIVAITTKVINKYSKNWNKCTVFTGYCHDNYNGFSLTYQDSESTEIGYWGELYSNIANDEMYSFEGYNHINEILKKYYIFCQNEPNLRWNKGIIIFYPDGHYESVFEWDEEAHIASLIQDTELWLASMYEQCVGMMFGKCQELDIPWDFETEVSIYFSKGISSYVDFKSPQNDLFTFRMFLEQVHGYEGDYQTAYEVYAPQRNDNNIWKKKGESMYYLMNEGELKGRYPRWNVAHFTLGEKKPQWYEQGVITFEWHDELEH